MKPVIAAVLVLVVLHTDPTPIEWLAILIICGAVAAEALVSEWQRRRRSVRQPA